MNEAPDPAELRKQIERRRRAWSTADPGHLVGRGHPAGDFLEAYEWKVLERRPGYVRLDCHLPDHVKNPRGQLFGGFTPTYVDFIALFTIHEGHSDENRWDFWLATTNMRVDYLEPVLGPHFRVESRLINERKRTCLAETRFLSTEGTLLVFALTTIRKIPMDKALGDA